MSFLAVCCAAQVLTHMDGISFSRTYAFLEQHDADVGTLLTLEDIETMMSDAYDQVAAGTTNSNSVSSSLASSSSSDLLAFPSLTVYRDAMLHFIFHLTVRRQGLSAGDYELHRATLRQCLICRQYPRVAVMDATPIRMKQRLLASSYRGLGPACSVCAPVPRASDLNDRCLFSLSLQPNARIVFDTRDQAAAPDIFSEELFEKLFTDLHRHVLPESKESQCSIFAKQVIALAWGVPGIASTIKSGCNSDTILKKGHKDSTGKWQKASWEHYAPLGQFRRRRGVTKPTRTSSAFDWRTYSLYRIFRALAGSVAVSVLLPYKLAKSITTSSRQTFWQDQQATVLNSVSLELYALLSADVLADSSRQVSEEMWRFLQELSSIVVSGAERKPTHSACSHVPVLPGRSHEEKSILSGAYYCFGTGSPLRHRKKYDMDEQKDENTCSHKFSKHGGWTGSVFECVCPHSFPYGAHILKDAEGRKDPFRLIMTYFPIEIDDVGEFLAYLEELLYDFGCSASEYKLNREHHLLRYVSTHIDRFHGPGHKCSSIYKADQYPGLIGVNSQVSEQFNSLIKPFQQIGREHV